VNNIYEFRFKILKKVETFPAILHGNKLRGGKRVKHRKRNNVELTSCNSLSKKSKLHLAMSKGKKWQPQ